PHFTQFDDNGRLPPVVAHSVQLDDNGRLPPVVAHSVQLDDNGRLPPVVAHSVQLDDNGRLPPVVAHSVQLDDNGRLPPVVAHSVQLDDNGRLPPVVVRSVQLNNNRGHLLILQSQGYLVLSDPTTGGHFIPSENSAGSQHRNHPSPIHPSLREYLVPDRTRMSSNLAQPLSVFNVEVPTVNGPKIKGILTSPNSTTLPRWEIPPLGPYGENDTAWAGLKTQWAFDGFYYLAFAPLERDYSGPVFGCLSSDGGEVVEDRCNGRTMYRLDPTKCQQWLYLESQLRHILGVLARSTAVLFPLYDRNPQSPSFENYHTPRPTRAKMKNAIGFARARFTQWLAKISYTICISTSEDDEGQELPYWATRILEQQEMEPQMVNALLDSWVCDWNAPRVGAYIDIGRGAVCSESEYWSTSWYDQIPKVLSKVSCVPMWFFYGEPPCLRSALPWYPAAVNSQQSTPATIIPQQPISTGDWGNYAGDCGDLAPGWQSLGGNNGNNSLQGQPKRGETVFSFLDRQKEVKKAVIAQETCTDRTRRLERERQQESQTVPIKSGPKVWMWKEKADSKWVREFVSVKKLASVWRSTVPSQRVYNSIRHEYDICVELDPDASPTDSDIEDDLDTEDDVDMDTGGGGTSAWSPPLTLSPWSLPPTLTLMLSPWSPTLTLSPWSLPPTLTLMLSPWSPPLTLSPWSLPPTLTLMLSPWSPPLTLSPRSPPLTLSPRSPPLTLTPWSLPPTLTLMLSPWSPPLTLTPWSLPPTLTLMLSTFTRSPH
ncbi:hypothetical protein PHLCEN_2v1961, partial [Hermanssonia centrifuga]